MPDPDFKKRRGRGHPNLEITGRPGLKNVFSRDGGGGGVHGPSPRSATDIIYIYIKGAPSM